jgi:hypothetical protein
MAVQGQAPGTIRMIEVYEQTVRDVPADSVPSRQRFVMLDKNGVETNDPALATERISIVKVRILRLDASGGLAPAARAVQIEILEYGPSDRLLRSTLMRKD